MELVKLFKTADFIDKEKTEFSTRSTRVQYLIIEFV